MLFVTSAKLSNPALCMGITENDKAQNTRWAHGHGITWCRLQGGGSLTWRGCFCQWDSLLGGKKRVPGRRINWPWLAACCCSSRISTYHIYGEQTSSISRVMDQVWVPSFVCVPELSLPLFNCIHCSCGHNRYWVEFEALVWQKPWSWLSSPYCKWFWIVLHGSRLLSSMSVTALLLLRTSGLVSCGKWYSVYWLTLPLQNSLNLDLFSHYISLHCANGRVSTYS